CTANEERQPRLLRARALSTIPIENQGNHRADQRQRPTSLPSTGPHMQPRRSEKSHELTPEERSRGGRMRAAKIYTAKAEAAAQGKPYKPLRRRRRRSAFGLSDDPYVSAAWRERVAAGEPEE